METETIELDRIEAARLFRKYREHRHNLGKPNPADIEVERAYKAIAAGKVVIRAIESVRTSGLGPDGFPKLALVRADSQKCWCEMQTHGGGVQSMAEWRRPVRENTIPDDRFAFPAGTWPRRDRTLRASATVPHIPPDIRPTRALQNYHILFEALWRPEPPRDPMLLRRIGKADLWLVVGAWDLTEVERAAMATRIKS